MHSSAQHVEVTMSKEFETRVVVLVRADGEMSNPIAIRVAKGTDLSAPVAISVKPEKGINPVSGEATDEVVISYQGWKRSHSREWFNSEGYARFVSSRYTTMAVQFDLTVDQVKQDMQSGYLEAL